MTARAVRFVVIGVCAAGVAGMIVTSATDHSGAALTFGLVTAVAILCLMVATAVGGGTHEGPAGDQEADAARLEAAIGALIARGADERDVRELVRRAVAYGRRSGRNPQVIGRDADIERE
jgi:hypothetical protein